MNKMKMGVAVLAAAFGFAAVGAAHAADKGLVGVSMPNKSTERWIGDGNNMVKYLKEAGYSTDLQYAEDEIPNQLAQIENMVTKGAKVLVIASIDGSALSDVLQKAADKGIKIIAYDRLITKTKNVDYYATFDNFSVGVLQANSLLDGMKKAGSGPYKVELFGGSPDDNNASVFNAGSMSVLTPLIDSGKIVVKSKQAAMTQIGTPGWSGEKAQARMDNLLSAFYGKDKIDGVLSPNDDIAIGVLSSLKSVGYCSAKATCPIVTGQDASLASVKSIVANEQYSTIYKDTRELAKVTVKMVDAVMTGSKLEINDTKSYNNGVKVVPSYLLKPIAVDKSNLKAVVIDSGYIAADKL